MTHILKYLDRAEVAELEDEGISELLLLKDQIAEMDRGIDKETEQTEHEGETEKIKTVNRQQELEIEQTTANAIVKDILHQPSPPNAQSNSFWRKDFKISGQIGEPGQRE